MLFEQLVKRRHHKRHPKEGKVDTVIGELFVFTMNLLCTEVADIAETPKKKSKKGKGV